MTAYRAFETARRTSPPTGRPRRIHDRPWAGLAVLAAAAIGVAGCNGGRASPQVASLPTTSVATRTSGGAGGSPTTTVPKSDATRLLDGWATCMHSHGDPDQADPTIDSENEINIHIPEDAQQLSGEVHNGTAPCNQYLTAAQRALRNGQSFPQPPSEVTEVKFAECMRANGVPNFPNPSGLNGSETNFRGTGIDPNSPLVEIPTSTARASSTSTPRTTRRWATQETSLSPAARATGLLPAARADRMAEFSVRRVVVIAAVAAALVGGVVAGGVAAATGSRRGSPVSSSSDGSGSLDTTAVVRTTLTATVQVGGSIGYEGSYTVAAPSGTSAQDLAQARQTATGDQQALSADEQAESDAAGADDQAIAAAQAIVDTDRSTLSSDQATQTRDCAGKGSSTPACSQDAQKITQDQTQLAQSDQQVIAAESTATRDRDQSQAKVISDQTKLNGDQATLASMQASAVNPGTTYTALPTVGQVIRQDQAVYAVSNEPVPLLYGSVAAYRAFYAGMSDGADIGELTHDLIGLGYGAGLAQSDHYSSAVASAVERWQSALGLPATGEILLGQVVFEPGSIRVTSVTPSVGTTLGGGGGSVSGGGASGGGGVVLTATSTTPIVTVDLDVSQEYLVKPGDGVSIVLPDGSSTVGGHIDTVGSVATCPSGGGTGTGNANVGSSADQSPCSSGGANNTLTVTVTIGLDRIASGATLDQAPVNVNITTQRAADVLAVPVNALLALAGGGFGVEVVSGNSSHLVGVTTGVYSSTLVQISGSGITAGTRVQIPSS